jgi:hypothetical protein
MNTLPLRLIEDHLFLQIDGGFWLVDTGAPHSFGTAPTVTIASRSFDLGEHYVGLTADALSGAVGVECEGLLGVDVLNHFDVLFDVPREAATIVQQDLHPFGVRLDLKAYMGIPIVAASVGGTTYPMFFDTGAQISYLHSGDFETFPLAGSLQDFYPGFGEFRTEVRRIDMEIGDLRVILRCGVLLPTACGDAGNGRNARDHRARPDPGQAGRICAKAGTDVVGGVI